MIQLKTTDSLQVLLAGAVTTSQAVLYASYADIATDGSTFAPSPSSGATNGTTAVDWVTAPAAGIRAVKYLSLYNADTASMTATARVVDNGTNRILAKVALATGERLEYTDGQGFRVLSATGAEKGSSSGGGGSSSDAVTALTISSGAVNIDCSLGKTFTLSLTANVTSITFSNLNGAGFATEIEVQFTQDGTGSRTVALPAAFKALGGSDTSVASAASAVTVLSAKTFDNGTTWRYAMQESA